MSCVITTGTFPSCSTGHPSKSEVKSRAIIEGESLEIKAMSVICVLWQGGKGPLGDLFVFNIIKYAGAIQKWLSQRPT